MVHSQTKTAFVVMGSYAKVNFVLRSHLIDDLIARGFKLILFTPFTNETWFQDEFGSRAQLESFDEQGSGSIAAFIERVKQEAFALHTPRLQSGLAILDRAKSRFKNPAEAKGGARARAVYRLLPRFLSSKEWFWRFIKKVFVHSAYYRRAFSLYKPDIVVLDSPGPVCFLSYVERNNVPAVLIDINTDALQARYPYKFSSNIKAITVVGESMQEEAHEANLIPLSKLPIVGSVRYDHYFKKEFRQTTRDEYVTQLGLDPSKKIIVYATVHPLLFSGNAKVIETILNAIDSGVLEDAQLLVSYGLGSDTTPYTELFKGRKNIILKHVEDRMHRDEMADLLRFSDVVVSVGSTMAFEAAAVDTPTIWIGYDAEKGSGNSIEELFSIPYLKIPIDTGGVKLVTSETTLVQSLKAYLGNRSIDSEKRSHMLEMVYYKKDGNAAKRIAEVIEKVSRGESPI